MRRDRHTGAVFTSDAKVPDPHVIVLFGALGDLSRRKLLPGLFHLDAAGLMPDQYRILGTSRRGGSVDDFLDVARSAIGDGARGDGWRRFARRLAFSEFSAEAPGHLVDAVNAAEQEIGGEPRRLHYLAIPPVAFAETVRALGASALAERARLVLRSRSVRIFRARAS
jgi:glucose-6-phosphate 1-dehydrogenase